MAGSFDPRPTSPAEFVLEIARLPPHVFFAISAVFHYLGPAFAVLLFAAVEPLGVAWLRIAGAAAVFALWRRPWRLLGRLRMRETGMILALGVVLALMNGAFYLALERLPLGTVGAIEFLGPVSLALAGLKTRRNGHALLLAVAGVVLLTDPRFEGEAIGFLFAFVNCALFTLYVVVGHTVARAGDRIDRLALAMFVALVVAAPIGFTPSVVAFASPVLLLASLGVAVCSSVIPYVCDQFAMARLPRASFSLMLALLPMTAVLVGIVVLRQIPSWREAAGIGLVVTAVALHRVEG